MSSMDHFACTRCAARQDLDARCRGCGNDIVHDLRESRTRYMLSELEARWQSKQHGRFIKAGAIAGVITLLVMIGLMFALQGDSPASEQRPVSSTAQQARDRESTRSMTGWMKLTALVTGGVAFAVMAGTSAIFGRRRRFPYLSEYDGPT